MPDYFEPTKRGIKQLTDHIKRGGKGTTVYTITQHKDWGIGAETTYNDHTFTHRQPLTGIWLAGTDSAHGLLAKYGRVYTKPPRNIRYIGDPAPQVSFPLGADYRGYIDEAEIRGLEKRLKDAPARGTRRI